MKTRTTDEKIAEQLSVIEHELSFFYTREGNVPNNDESMKIILSATDSIGKLVSQMEECC